MSTSLNLRPDQLSAFQRTAQEVESLISELEELAEPLPFAERHRPISPDPDDDVVLEAAINGRADLILSHNIRHLREAAARFKIEVVTPAGVPPAPATRGVSIQGEPKHESSSAVMVFLDPSLLAEVEAYSAKEGISLDSFIGTASAELVRRRKEEEWYARPRHSTPEGRVRAIASLEQNTTAPSDPNDTLLK